MSPSQKKGLFQASVLSRHGLQEGSLMERFITQHHCPAVALKHPGKAHTWPGLGSQPSLRATGGLSPQMSPLGQPIRRIQPDSGTLSLGETPCLGTTAKFHQATDPAVVPSRDEPRPVGPESEKVSHRGSLTDSREHER